MRIQAAKKEAKEIASEGEDHRSIYNAEVDKSKDSDVNVNLLYVDVKQSIASTYAQNPKIFFTPENPESEKACEIFELLTSHLLNKLKFKKTIRKIAKTAKFDPIVATKTYFYFKMNPSGKKPFYDDSVFNDEVRTDLVLIGKVFKDPDCETYEESPYIIHEIDDTVSNIIEKFGLTEDEAGQICGDTEKPEGKFDFNARAYQFICYYEIEDRISGNIFYIVPGVEKVLAERSKDYSYDSMWDFLDRNHVPGSKKRHSDAYFWKDQRRDYNNFRTMFSEHAYKGAAKMLFRGSDLTQDQENQLLSPESKGLVRLNPDQNVDRLQHAQIDPQVVAAFQQTQQEIQLISKNVPRQSQNEKTATEVKAVEAAAQEVESEDRDLLEEMIASIATKWAKLAYVKYDVDRVIRITGRTDSEFIGFQNKFKDKVWKNGEAIYLKFSKKDLSDKVFASVKAGSMLPDNQQNRMNRFLGFTKFISSLPNAQSVLDMNEVVNEAMQVFGVENDNLLRAKDNPFDESKLLNSGVFIAPKMSDDDDYHLEIHKAQTNGSPETEMHMFIHTMQKREKEKVLEMQAAKQMQMAQMQQTMTGASFMGQGFPSPLPTQPGISGVGPNQIPDINAANVGGNVPPMMPQ